MNETQKPKRTEPSNGGLSNRGWPYVKEMHTDIRKTFDRVRNEQREQRAFAEKQGKPQ